MATFAISCSPLGCVHMVHIDDIRRLLTCSNESCLEVETGSSLKIRERPTSSYLRLKLSVRRSVAEVMEMRQPGSIDSRRCTAAHALRCPACMTASCGDGTLKMHHPGKSPEGFRAQRLPHWRYRSDGFHIVQDLRSSCGERASLCSSFQVQTWRVTHSA